MGDTAMRPKEIAIEAWRNVISGTSRALLLGATLAMVCASLTVADGLATRASLDEADQYRSSGSSIKTVAAVGAIDPRACGAIASVDGVTSAGAIRKAADSLRPLALPTGSVPAYEVTPAFAEMIADLHDAGGGIFLSEAVAKRLGASVGDPVSLANGSAVVAGVFAWPDDGRRPDLGYAALLPIVATGPFDECWAEAWPESPNLESSLRTAVVMEKVETSNPPEIGAVNRSLGTQFHGDDRYASRITQYGQYFAAAFAGLVAAFAIWLRRLELATGQHLGVRPVDQLVMILVEMAYVLVLPVLVGVAIAIAFARAEPGELLSLLFVGLRPTAGLIIGAVTGTSIAALMIRERSFLGYFARRA